MVDDEDVDAAQHIEECHEWHEHATYLRNGLYATDDNGSSECCDNGTRDIRRNAILVLYQGRDGVSLYGASDAERGEGGKECEEDG